MPWPSPRDCSTALELLVRYGLWTRQNNRLAGRPCPSTLLSKAERKCDSRSSSSFASPATAVRILRRQNAARAYTRERTRITLVVMEPGFFLDSLGQLAKPCGSLPGLTTALAESSFTASGWPMTATPSD